MNQEVEFNYQVEIQDHIHSQVQFQGRDNLPNVNVIFKIWCLYKFNWCAEMESCFSKQHNSLALAEWLATSGIVKG